jgi:hypothetical protein
MDPKLLLLLQILAAVLAMLLIVRLITRRRARTTYERIRTLYGGRFELVAASLNDFPNASRELYARCAAEFERLGFQSLGDVENRTHSRLYPSYRMPSRFLLGAHGIVGIVATQAPAPPLRRFVSTFLRSAASNSMLIEVFTEYDSGVFLLTTNKENQEPLLNVPGTMAMLRPLRTPIEQLVNEHLAMVDQWRTTHAGMLPIRFSNLEEMIESRHRLHVLRCEDRKKAGYLSGEEVRRMTPAALRWMNSFFQSEVDRAREKSIRRARRETAEEK